MSSFKAISRLISAAGIALAVLLLRVFARRDEQLRLQSAALEAADNSIVITDRDGIIVWVNEAFCRATGYSKSEILGNNPRVLKSDRQTPAFYRELWETISGGRVWHGELINRRKDGSEYLEEMTVTPVLNNRRLTHFIAVKQDVSERSKFLLREHESRVQAERAVRLRDEFISIASHELKTPITPLKMKAQALERAIDSGHRAQPEELAEFLRAVQKQVDRVARLVDDMLDISRIMTGQLAMVMRACNLTELVEQVVKRFRTEGRAGAAISLEADDDLIIHADRVRIEQVLSNLVSNALKYGSGKPVSVTLKRHGLRTARISVRDHGIGISKADQKRIFERFERAVSVTNISGLGVGLYVANQIAKAHEGRIEVESEVGKGAVFSLELPLCDSPLSVGIRTLAGR